ncbi:putative cold-shock DEAD-box protein [Gordonia polyisoprenivorans VH2]|uniref:ATP-dependent RNA helicase DeaD n=2 Tax=Gordonia polyisoprenivorans TaxID=84595 RepID=H6MX10_GORPV|nr:DEAD/DEAH box helicase [Gordonia polyisoprenivorans]AFA72932.1 putative cold-shock DEAD-box protein [Gordonia polyisoprenivorans VH2]NKY02537.1 DEAD/DEAH box helicase [Gordonia polyisoprenivorans]UZF58357.1 DEAD/DEAH box helicase [Gordonia polyisoprenivorans]GAB24845.1 ATP-dependent DEAD-box RNA helicase DeaD [Gordonia polyisoprenivorans NBRC 16320 = JCM 10675]HCS58217.1 ATP-dependent RNA helicase [Gordonia polyisoprenivorans]
MTETPAADRPDADAITFDDLDIDDRVRSAIAEVGYETPSPIQAATIPPLMAGRDVVGLAQTGTGKTAAFAIPILSRIDPAVRRPQALILAPTRELALQVSEAFSRYSAHMPEVRVLPIYGGQSYGVQLAGLRRGAQVIVGTPGRVIDHLDKGTLDISELEYLVLDEADEMLTMGFAEDVERILAETPDSKQVALFSATMPSAIRRLAQKYLHDPQEITVKSKTATAQNITQRYLQVSHQRKLDALTRFLEVETFDAMIVFVRTKQATEELAERLRARGFSAVAINGDMVQAQRERTINQLKDGGIDILVATDVAARGLDVDRISHVVNYDIPHDTESYVHRIGRTGRAGRSGNALLFVSPRERHLLRAIERATRQPLTEIGLPSVEDVNAQRVARFADSITENLTSDHLDMFRKLVEDYARDKDVAMADIAAALALETRDGGFLMAPDPPESERPARREREPRKGGGSYATYRIAVGRKHKVSPGAIVGAIANEGGLTRGDFGNISIRDDFSLVELPDNLDRDTLDRLRDTRIGKHPIDLRRDQGPPRARGGNKRAGQGQRGRDGHHSRGDSWGKRGSRHVAGRGRS